MSQANDSTLFNTKDYLSGYLNSLLEIPSHRKSTSPNPRAPASKASFTQYSRESMGLTAQSPTEVRVVAKLVKKEIPATTWRECPKTFTITGSSSRAQLRQSRHLRHSSQSSFSGNQMQSIDTVGLGGAEDYGRIEGARNSSRRTSI